MKYLPLMVFIIVISLGINYFIVLRALSYVKAAILLIAEVLVSLLLTPILNVFTLFVGPLLRIITPSSFWGYGDEGWNAIIVFSVFFGQLFIVIINYIYSSKKRAKNL